jgi:hypothetical protein
MSYKIYRFGSTVLPNYNPVNDIGAGPAKLAMLDLPGGGVFDALGADQAPVGGVRITKECTLHDETESGLETAYTNLRSLIGKRDQLHRLHFSSGYEQWVYARLAQVRGYRRPMDILTLDVVLEFVQISPIWNGNSHNDDWGLTSNPATAQIYNNGNAIVEDVIITITAAGSNITNLVIRKKVGGTTYGHLIYTGTIAVGQSLVIDCGARSVKNNGSPDYAHFSLGPDQKNDAWIRLGAGLNNIEITRTGGSTSCNSNFVFYDGWQ